MPLNTCFWRFSFKSMRVIFSFHEFFPLTARWTGRSTPRSRLFSSSAAAYYNFDHTSEQPTFLFISHCSSFSSANIQNRHNFSRQLRDANGRQCFFNQNIFFDLQINSRMSGIRIIIRIKIFRCFQFCFLQALQ